MSSFVAEKEEEDYTVKVVNSRAKNPRNLRIKVGKESEVSFRLMTALGPKQAERVAKLGGVVESLSEEEAEAVGSATLEEMLLLLSGGNKAQTDWVLEELPVDVIQEILLALFEAQAEEVKK